MNYQQEMQKEFKNILEIAHRKTFKMFYNYKNKKDVTKEFIELLSFIFNEIKVIEKDIKIEVTDDQSN